MPNSKTFFYHDDFLPIDLANNFSDSFLGDQTWKSGWNIGLSKTEERQWNWHKAIDNDERGFSGQATDVSQLDPNTKILWDHVYELLRKSIYVPYKLDRFYANSHTYGQDGAIHTDDGDLTIIYYPCKDWQCHWEGGTAFYNDNQTDCLKYVSYKFNRIIVFGSKIPHRAMPVTRECYRLRTSVVFKTIKDVNSQEYMEEYYANG